jgi:type II secretory pathway pseudopilin PulG
MVMSVQGALPRPQQGFTYLGVLIAVALTGVALSVGSEVWVKVTERQKLAQLDWVGEQYVQAIGSYYYANTGSVHYYPKDLDDLLEDKRHLDMVRHLRKIYPNPLTNQVDWMLIPAPTGGITGVEVKTSTGDLRRYVWHI